MRLRIIGSAALLAAGVSLSVSIGTSVSGQERPTTPALVVTAFGGEATAATGERDQER